MEKKRSPGHQFRRASGMEQASRTSRAGPGLSNGRVLFVVTKSLSAEDPLIPDVYEGPRLMRGNMRVSAALFLLDGAVK